MEPKPLAHPTVESSALEARAQAVERLCDGFSHDTRNPLNAVVIHLEVLSDKLRRENGGTVPPGMEKNLKAIRDQVGRIDEMVRRFVELAAPRRQHEADFDVSALVHSVVEQCTHQARLSRSDLRAEVSPGLRVPGSASDLGVALTLFLLQQVEAGAKRIVVRTESSGGTAVLTLEGTVASSEAATGGLSAVASRFHGTLRTDAGRVELRLSMASEPALRVVDADGHAEQG